MNLAALGLSLAQAAPTVILVEEPAEVTPRQLRRIERRVGDVVLAPLGSLWQRGRELRRVPEVSGPCASEVEAVAALGPLLTPGQRPELLRAWVDVALCAEKHDLTHEPFRWDLPIGMIDPYALRAAELVAASPELGATLDDAARTLLERQDLDLPGLMVGWDDEAAPPIVDGNQVAPVAGQVRVPPCGADITWSYGGIPGGSEHVHLEGGTYWYPLQVATHQGRKLLHELEHPPIAPVHLQHAAIYEELVGSFVVARFEGRMRLWRWESGSFVAVPGARRP